MPTKVPQDPRSTGRKRGRKTLYRVKRPHYCTNCKRGPVELPPDAPKDLELAEESKRYKGLALECNHINKNILDNDPVNVQWLCKSCHKRADLVTEKGVSTVENEFGYGI